MCVCCRWGFPKCIAQILDFPRCCFSFHLDLECEMWIIRKHSYLFHFRLTLVSCSSIQSSALSLSLTRLKVPRNFLSPHHSRALLINSCVPLPFPSRIRKCIEYCIYIYLLYIFIHTLCVRVSQNIWNWMLLVLPKIKYIYIRHATQINIYVRALTTTAPQGLRK